MPAAFSILTAALAGGALSDRCVVTQSGVTRTVGCVFVRRQELVETPQGDVYVAAEPKISLRITDLVRRPQKGDTAEILSGEHAGIWKLGVGLETGAGMIECPVTRT